MEPFFDPDETRWIAAGLFIGVAGLLGLIFGGMALLQRRANWPMFVGGLVGLCLWQLTSIGLLLDGNNLAASILTGLIVLLCGAGCCTFLVNKHSWLIAVAFALLGSGALLAELATVPAVAEALPWPGEALCFWLAGMGSGGLICLLAIVSFSGKWWPALAYAFAAPMLVALGGACAGATSFGASNLWRDLANVRVGQPLWLILLVLIPVVIGVGFRSLAGLGELRRWLALGLRCLLILLLCLALAEICLLHTSETVTVLFLWDRSLSMPHEPDPLDTNPNKKDLIKERHMAFIWNAVAQRGATHQRDHAGLIVFGRYPRLELPPSNVPGFGPRKITTSVDDSYTDISAALKLAFACFPENSGKRIVLISDGNENLGKAEDLARIAKQNGVEIDTVPVISANRNQHEIVVEGIVPQNVDPGVPLPLRIVIRSYCPEPVIGRLVVTKTSVRLNLDKKDGADNAQNPFENQPVSDRLERILPGPNVIYREDPNVEEKQSYTYKVKFIPLGVEKVRIDLANADLENRDKNKLDPEPVKLDRPENNYAITSVLGGSDGKKVLLIEPTIGDHTFLLKTLRESPMSLKVGVITPAQLPHDPDQLNFLLSSFDCVILGNVPRDSITPEQDAAFRNAVHEQGTGLIMIGGRQGFGAGGWQGTEVEKALPVTCDLKSLKVEGRSGLVLIMHASEIPAGNVWQRKVAKLAIEKLAPVDMLGLLYFDGGTKWHIPFDIVGDNKENMLRRVDNMTPGDMPDVEPHLKKAHAELTDPKYDLGTKHIIFISDGDVVPPSLATLEMIKAAKITVTTVCITSHGQGEYNNMARIARVTGGREYPAPDANGKYAPLDPQQLPQIYIKETRLVSQAFIYAKKFDPILMERGGPTKGLDELKALHGFVRTSPRPGPLVQLPIMTPKLGDNAFPILAHWQYGLGKAAAFTSDAQTSPGKPPAWDRDWASSDMYAKFWEQLVGWSVRKMDKSKNLQIATETRDGKVLIVVDARDDQQRPLPDLDIVARVTSPVPGDGGRPDIKLQQKNVGRYEAEIRAEDVGSYFITAVATKTKTVDGKMVREPFGMARAAANVAYSPEYAEMESNPDLLHRLSALTGGKVYADEAGVLQRTALGGDVFRQTPVRARNLQSIWYWLLMLTGVGMFFDVAVRRVAIDPAAVAAFAQARWQALRGMQPLAAKSQVFLDRLKSRKEQVGESLEKQKAARRFDGNKGEGEGERPIQAPPMADVDSVPQNKPDQPTPPPGVAPEDKKDDGDYASRLLRAKRRALEQRDKDNPPKQ